MSLNALRWWWGRGDVGSGSDASGEEGSEGSVEEWDVTGRRSTRLKLR